jgi:probable O-glycosylation ligase (exosortase A-associated)
VPAQFWDRQRSILEYQADLSATSRLENWKFCWKLALDRPLTGGGFNYNTTETFNRYAPEFLVKWQGRTWDSHSIYWGILAAHGFPGLFLFLAMILFCLLSCRKIKKAVRDNPELQWAKSYAAMIQISFLALLINGATLNMEYFELDYSLVALTASFKVLVNTLVSKTEKNLQESTEIDSVIAVAQ